MMGNMFPLLGKIDFTGKNMFPLLGKIVLLTKLRICTSGKCIFTNGKNSFYR